MEKGSNSNFMRFRKMTPVILCFAAAMVLGQNHDPVLFSIDGDAVHNSEFIRVYEKNKDLVVDEQNKDFDDYFELFVDFKLKLRQARDMQLDTLSSYTEELEIYREQLIQPYLKNPEALDALAEEAYERSLYEVNASHILVMVDLNASPQDTLAAYEKIQKARLELIDGNEFQAVAKKYSEDPSVKENGGALGYFSAFAMVYPFENMAYNTEVGKVSQPFRTKFGYHIIRVNDKRISPGEVQVAHIMVAKDSANPTSSEEKINDIHSKLVQGDDFASIARAHSDDRSSSVKGGMLPKFSTGRMIKPFEDVAFKLENEGEFSTPFETVYGWHILKLLKKIPVESYEVMKPKLESRIRSGSRSTYVKRDLAERISKNYQIEENKVLLDKDYDLAAFQGNAEILLRINEEEFSGNDFFLFSQGNKEESKKERYEAFRSEKIIDYYKDHLEEINPDFALTYAEYRDGLLLFELLQREVWNRAEQDSVGLQNYYEDNKGKYVWKKRADLTIGSCTRRDKAEEVRSLLEKGMSTDSIKAMINEGPTIHVLFSQGKLQEGSSKLPEGYKLEKGVSQVFEDTENRFTIVRTDKIYPPAQKELNEAKGEVISDYQNHLEKVWVDELRNTYSVKVNKKSYNNLKAELENI